MAVNNRPNMVGMHLGPKIRVARLGMRTKFAARQVYSRKVQIAKRALAAVPPT